MVNEQKETTIFQVWETAEPILDHLIIRSLLSVSQGRLDGKGSCQVFITIKPGRHLAELVKKSIDRESGFPNPPKDEGQAFGIASGKHRAAIFDELNDRKIGYLNQNKQEDSQCASRNKEHTIIQSITSNLESLYLQSGLGKSSNRGNETGRENITIVEQLASAGTGRNSHKVDKTNCL
ncbi:hypothetical protein MJO29_013050 [Puccinia striiformis f. sp. tritici]|nr:hypothetical protein MJO29_013050 [Puccinia striiformis f. sp. tritici]